MAFDAGSIEYDIDVNTDQLLGAKSKVKDFNNNADKGFTKTGKSADGLASKLTKVASAVGAAFAASRLIGFVQSTSNAIDTQKKFADRIQISFEELQKLQFVAGQTGVSIETLNVGLQRMARRLETVAQGGAPEVKKQLDLMGLSIKDIQALSPDKQFLALADAINKLDGESQKTAAAFAIFDSGAVGLTNTFRLGSKAITDLGMQLEKVGGIVSTETAADFEAFNDQLDVMSKAAGGVGTSLVASMLPAFKNISSIVLDFLNDGDKLKNTLDGIGTAAIAISTIIAGRVVSAFGAFIASQVGAATAAVRASVAISASGNIMVATTAKAIALTAASRALSVVMGLLGGPAGLIFTVVAAMVALSASTEDAGEALDAINKRADAFSNIAKSLSKEQLDTKIQETKKEMMALGKEIDKLSENKLSFLGFTEEGKKLELLKAQLERANEKASIFIKVKSDSEAIKSAKKSVDGLLQAFERKPKTFTLDDFINFAESASLDNMSPMQVIEASEQAAIKELEALYNQFEGYTEQYTKAKSDIEAKYAADKAKLNKEIIAEEQALIDEFKAFADEVKSGNLTPLDAINESEKKAIAELRKLGEKAKVDQKEINAAITEIGKKANAERDKLNQETIDKQKDLYKRLNDLTANYKKELATPSELIKINEQAALDDLDAIYAEGIEKDQDYFDKKILIKKAFAKQLKELNDKEAQVAKDKLDRENKERADEDKKQQGANDAFRDQIKADKLRSPLEEIAYKEELAKEKLKELYDASTADFEEYQQGLKDIQERYNQERINLAEQEQSQMIANYSMMAGSLGSMFGEFASVAKETKGETSSAYKALFAVSKGFAVAQAGLNFALALTNALASGPFPANLGAIASVGAAGVGLVGAVTSATYSGRANGGPISAGNQYKVNENGRPEVLSVGGSDYLTSSRNAKITPLEQFGDNGSGVSGNITIINQTTGRIDTVEQSIDRNQVVLIIKETMPAEISDPNSKTSRALQASTDVKRRVT